MAGFRESLRVRCWSSWRWMLAVMNNSASGVRSMGCWVLAVRLGSVRGFGLGLQVISRARRWQTWVAVVGGALWSTVVWMMALSLGVW